MKDILSKCNLCPRNCNINRHITTGFCGAKDKLVVARAQIYYYEEPCISGKNGSGAIFFSYCNLKCIFCQNYEISEKHLGKEITIEKFADICLDLQNKKANNINLVTPTHFIPLIKEGLILAKKKGLKIPIIYNTSSYENVESLKLLDGLIDVYLPDFKYYNNKYAIKYSKANNYVETAKDAINEMYRQVGKCKFNKNGIITKGVIVRHLMLPSQEMKEDTKKVLYYLYNTYKDNIYISIMNQYTPVKQYKEKELNDTISENDYNDIIDYAYNLGIRNAFVQIGETQKLSFIPDFKHPNF